MSGICGWLGDPGEPSNAERTLLAMSECLTRFDGTSAQRACGQDFGIAVAAQNNLAVLARKDGCHAVVWGTLRSRQARSLSEQNAAELLIDAYRTSGTDCCMSFSGSAAYALIDERANCVLLATDRVGAYALIYSLAKGSFVFGSTADALNRHPLIEPEIDWQSIYNYVHFHVVAGPASVHRGQRRLMPGEYVVFRGGSVATRRYWRMHYVEDNPAAFDSLKREFVDVLTDSVRRHAHAFPTGSFLSGGTDSSTVAGLLGKVSGKAAPTFSIGFDSAGYDEMEYARIAARRFATDHHEYYVTPADIVDAIPRLAEIYDQPFGNSSAVPAYFCARLAKSTGMNHLLGGDGGDELFGGNERYATQHLFSLYERIPAGMRHGLIEPLARIMPRSRKLLPLRWFRRGVELAATPMPDRLDAYNLLLQFGPEHVFCPEVLAQIDRTQPVQLMREEFSGADASSLINRMLALDMRFTIADNDLPKVVKSCELAGIPVSFPLLDDDVIDFAAKLPPRMKLKGTRLRYFFKEALRGFLPDEIITKRKHGFGLPFGPWLKVHRPLEELVGDHLADLKKRRLIQPRLIDELLADRIAEAPGYYGTMAWVLMMLEGWFKKHVETT